MSGIAPGFSTEAIYQFVKSKRLGIQVQSKRDPERVRFVLSTEESRLPPDLAKIPAVKPGSK